MHDIMHYLERDLEKRIDPWALLPDARSLVVTGLSYYSEIMQKDPDAPLLSRYTYGTDYHDVIKGKLKDLLSWIEKAVPEASGKIVVDSSSMTEKAWAKEAGLGWQGRNSIIINKETGSFFFIGILILNIDLTFDEPFTKDHCGECRICQDECPTGAINGDRTIDARKCIANVTIGRRGPVPENIVPFIGKRVYGCDKCQEVCPWNKSPEVGRTPEFKIDDEIAGMTAEEWEKLSKEQFRRLFRKTAMKRVSYEKMMSNIEAALKS
jgi:epoxyqueuosine reductase